MADIDTSGGGHKKGPGVKKGKKLSTRVDLTPMVDLGFLLITFFIFTTTMSSPTAMKLAVPKDTKDEKDLTKIKQSGALTLILGKADQIYYYMGELTNPNEQWKTATYKQIRDIILQKKKDVVNASGINQSYDDLLKDTTDGSKSSDRDFMVIIKPSADATYKNTVDILDEMKINVVRRYALVDVTDEEMVFVRATEASNGIK